MMGYCICACMLPWFQQIVSLHCCSKHSIQSVQDKHTLEYKNMMIFFHIALHQSPTATLTMSEIPRKAFITHEEDDQEQKFSPVLSYQPLDSEAALRVESDHAPEATATSSNPQETDSSTFRPEDTLLNAPQQVSERPMGPSLQSPERRFTTNPEGQGTIRSTGGLGIQYNEERQGQNGSSESRMTPCGDRSAPAATPTRRQPREIAETPQHYVRPRRPGQRSTSPQDLERIESPELGTTTHRARYAPAVTPIENHSGVSPGISGNDLEQSRPSQQSITAQDVSPFQPNASTYRDMAQPTRSYRSRGPSIAGSPFPGQVDRPPFARLDSERPEHAGRQASSSAEQSDSHDSCNSRYTRGRESISHRPRYNQEEEVSQNSSPRRANRRGPRGNGYSNELRPELIELHYALSARPFLQGRHFGTGPLPGRDAMDWVCSHPWLHHLRYENPIPFIPRTPILQDVHNEQRFIRLEQRQTEVDRELEVARTRLREVERRLAMLEKRSAKKGRGPGIDKDSS